MGGAHSGADKRTAKYLCGRTCASWRPVRVSAGGVGAVTGVVGLVEALAAIPDAGDVPAYRAVHLRGQGVLPRTFRQAERMLAGSEITPRGLAEAWAWCAYLEHVRGFQARSTIATYLRSLMRLQTWARGNDLDFAALTPAQFDGWQKYLAIALGHSPYHRNRQIYAVRSFFAWRSSRGMGPNIAADLRGPREARHVPRKYTVPQLQGMCRAAADQADPRLQFRDVALILFLLATGARREEVTKVAPGDLHLGARTGLVRLHGKGAKEREVSFEGPVADALAAWLMERERLPDYDPDAVFVTLSLNPRMTGRRLTLQAVDRIITRHARAAGLKEYGVHRFRVTFATALYDDNVGIEEIRILMGHESIETTRRYLSVSERMRRTRLRADRQHEVLGTRNTAQPRWLAAIQRKGGM